MAPSDVSAGGDVTSRLDGATTTGGSPGLVRHPYLLARVSKVDRQAPEVDDEPASSMTPSPASENRASKQLALMAWRASPIGLPVPDRGAVRRPPKRCSRCRA